MRIRFLIFIPLLICSCYSYIDKDNEDVDYYISLADDICNNDHCLLKEKHYFVVGNERRLWEQKIIRRVKGFTRQYYINPSVKGVQLKEIDAISTDSIYVKGSTIRILGVVPQQSYEIKDHFVIIRNKHMFWRYNKLLVVTYRSK